MLVVFASCNKKETPSENNSTPMNPPMNYFIATGKAEGYDMAVANLAKKTFYFLKTSASSTTKACMNVVLPENETRAAGNQSIATVLVDNNFKVTSVSVDDVSLVFREDTVEKKVSVMAIHNNISRIFEKICDIQEKTYSDSDSEAKKIIANLGCISEAVNTVLTTMTEADDIYEPLLAKKNHFLQIVGDFEALTNGETANDILDKVEKTTVEEFNNQIVDYANKYDDSVLEVVPSGIEDFIDDVKDDMEEQEEGAKDNDDSGRSALEVGIGALKVTLSWYFNADIDLHAYEPEYSGNTLGHIYYGQKRASYSDGYLDIDNTRGFYIDPVSSIHDRSRAAIENIFWKTPHDGEYKIALDYYGGSESGMCKLTVFYNGKGTTYEVYMNNSYNHSRGMRNVVNVRLQNGSIVLMPQNTRAAMQCSPVELPQK